MRRSGWLVALMLVVAGVGQAGPVSAQEVVDAADLDVAFTTSQQVLRPGDSFSAAVTVTNLSDAELTALSVEVAVAPQAVDITSSETPEAVAQATLDPNGTVIWQVAVLGPGESIDLGLTGAVVSQVVSLDTTPAVATVLHDTVEVVTTSIDLVPVMTITRTTGVVTIDGVQTVETRVTATPNTEIIDLSITETLTATIDAEPVRPVAMMRVENAQASAGRIEWTIPSPTVGDPIDVAYIAEYPPDLNAGLFDVSLAGSVADDRSEIYFSGEGTVEIATPRIEVTNVEIADESPDSPIRPGDTAAVTITFENTGAPVDDYIVKASVEGSTLAVTKALQGGSTSGSAISWKRVAGVGEESVSYNVAVKSDILEDRETELVALVEVGDTVVSRSAILVPVDTERRQGSNTSQWFALILLFMVLGFGALLLFARSPTGIRGPTAYVAVVIAILTAILILAFGLELASETTLTLLGAIAGYVLGQRKWQQYTDDKSKQESSQGAS
jgi:hypothetical protein